MSKPFENDVIVIDAEVIETFPEHDLGPMLDPSLVIRRRSALTYIALPLIFLTVTLLGGLRFAAVDNAFIFLKPPLICLVFAAILLVLFFRAHLLDLSGWLAETSPVLTNIANVVVLLAIFAASTQIFNSLLPEKGLPLWVVGFCFFWTLWNNLFSEFDTGKLLRSLAAMFGLAFVIKYLVLANLTATGDTNILQRIFDNPAKEAFTWLLDLPRYSAATGYVQFFALVLFLVGLFLTPRTTQR